MSNQFLKLRRSAVPGKIPTTSSLEFGEIALNTYDGLAFIKKSGSNGEEIVTIGATSGSFTGSLFGTASWAINAITASYAETTAPTFIDNLVTVGLPGSDTDYNSIKIAVDSITDSSANNTYTVRVYPGVYIEDTMTVPQYVAVKGDSSTTTIVSASNPNNRIFNMSDQSMLIDMQVQGSTGTGVSAIYYSSSTTPQTFAISYVENVRFGTNYTNATCEGLNGANIIMQCSNVKYGGYTSGSKSFDVGFVVTGSNSGIGRMQLRNVTSTNGGITGSADQVFAMANGPGCTFIVNGCLLTKSTGAARGTGFLAYNGASLRLTAVNFQRWEKAIYLPNTGSAPSIFGSALNFENDTYDLLVEHSSATGKVDGLDTFLKSIIPVNAPLYEVNQDPKRITVAKKGGDFSSISASVAWITDSAETNRYIIEVGPGKFIENEIDLRGRPYVSIVGSNIQTTEIFPSSSNQHIVRMGVNNEISFLSLNGAGSGYAAIYVDDIGDFAQAHKVSIYDSDTGIKVNASTVDTQFYGEYIDINGTYTYGLYISSSNTIGSFVNMENYYQFPVSSPITANYVVGPYSSLTLNSTLLQNDGTTNTIAFDLEDGAILEAGSLDIQGFDTAYYIPDVGLGPNIRASGVMIHDSLTYDFNNENASTQVRYDGIIDGAKIVNNSPTVYWNRLDDVTGQSYMNSIESTSVTASFLGDLEGTASWAENVLTASYVENAVSASWAATASSADNFVVRGDLTGSNAVFTGTITAQRLNVQYITASTELVTGSTKFGTQLGNTHQFTGSVTVTGSLSVNGGLVPLGSGTAGQVAVWSGSNQLSGSNNLFWDANNSRLGIGISSPTDTLTVTGSTLLRGAGSTSAADTLTVQNSGGTNLFRVRNDGMIWVGSSTSTSPRIFSYSTAATGVDLLGKNISLYSGTSTEAATNGTIAFSGDQLNGTSSVQTHIFSTRTFNPTSGTAIHNGFELRSTINQTGGANGITRGLYVNPTLTSAADWRAIETSNGRWVLTDTYSASGSLANPSIDIATTWNTSGTPTLIKANVTDTTSNANSLLMDLQVGGTSQFRALKSGILSRGGIYSGPVLSNTSGFIAVNPDDALTAIISGFNTAVRFSDTRATSSPGYSYWFSSLQYVNLDYTSSLGGFVTIRRGFAPTTGSGVFNVLNIENTISQSAAATGVTRGLYLNPTLTAAADWRSIEWSNNTGWGLYGAGTVKNYLNGSLLVGTTIDAGFKLDVNGSARITNGLIVTGSSTINNLTGSLFGTASWALNAVTASYVLNAVSSSFASTASFTTLAQTASYVLNAVSSSFSATASSADNFLIRGVLTVESASVDYQQNLSLQTGSWQTIVASPTGSYRAAFFDYAMFSGSIGRAGTVTTFWSASATEFYENYTEDLGGSTSGVILQTAISASQIVLQATASSAAWTIRSLVRLL